MSISFLPRVNLVVQEQIFFFFFAKYKVLVLHMLHPLTYNKTNNVRFHWPTILGHITTHNFIFLKGCGTLLQEGPCQMERKNSFRHK